MNNFLMYMLKINAEPPVPLSSLYTKHYCTGRYIACSIVDRAFICMYVAEKRLCSIENSFSNHQF